jgi:RHS repeat-associated protein
MTHFRQSTQHQLPAYQYVYGDKTASGVCLQNTTDYSPFGVTLDGRTMQGDGYRYSFQGQEHDDDVKGEGNSGNYKYRMHDPRVGRFFAVDPLAARYPHNSVYAFSENIVIDHVELEGLEKGKLTLDLDTRSGILTFEKIYQVITQGTYAVHDLEFYNSCEYQNGLANAISNENTIYITKIKYRKDGSLKKFKITNEAAYIVDESNEVFEIKVKYKIQVISEPGFTLKDSEKFIKADPILNGVISSPDPNNINQELNMDFKDTDMQAIGKNVIQSNEELLDPESQFYSVNYGIKEGVTPEYRKGRVTGHEAFHNFGLKHNRKNNSYESKGIMSKHVKFIEISKGNTEEMVKKNIKNITLEK